MMISIDFSFRQHANFWSNSKVRSSLKHPNRLIVHELIGITVQQRDRRLTGSITGQVAQAVAPPGFELNNPWKVGLLLTIICSGIS